MALLAHLLASLLMSTVSGGLPPSFPPPADPLPIPPRQTPAQELLIRQITADAAVASAAARLHLLELLSSAEFKAALGSCCAELQVMTPEQRLAWFDQESAAAEMVHNFGGGLTDVTVALGENASYFYNLWEVAILQRRGDDNPAGPPPPPTPPANCSLMPNACGFPPHGTCVPTPRGEGGPMSRGFTCVCDKGWTGESCSQRIPRNCSAVHARPACENLTSQINMPGEGALDCKWVTAQSRCVRVPSTEHMDQITDITEVGLFGFPAFHNASESTYTGVPSFTDAVNRPIYTAFNHRKVDVGNPMFGPVAAIFAPRYVRNMTLIAPIDTGAWEGECNTSFPATSSDSFVCDAIKSENACNDQSLKHGLCDWRTPIGQHKPSCVNVVYELGRCRSQKTAVQCAKAAGPSSPYSCDGGEHEPVGCSVPTPGWIWNQTLWNAGCAWDSQTQGCIDFNCGVFANQKACIAVTLEPNQTLYPGKQAKHCAWVEDTEGNGVCTTPSPDQFCKAQSKSVKPLPGMPHQDPQMLCESNSQCQWVAMTSNRSQGSCRAFHCDRLNLSECQQHSGYTMSGLSCAWVPDSPHIEVLSKPAQQSGRCVPFNGNCSALPTKEVCQENSMHNQSYLPYTCDWNRTADNTYSCVRTPRKHPQMAGFNCSSSAWFPSTSGLPWAPSYSLGTPALHHHTLAAGVTIWNDTAPGTQLGVLFRRMAEPYSTVIDSQEIFKYWEANIAGAPHFPNGIKMMVGSFSALFGTAAGEQLQRWCISRGWVLAWGLGSAATNATSKDSSPYGDSASHFSNRTLDPIVFAHTSAAHNLSLSAAEKQFLVLWHTVKNQTNHTNSQSSTCSTIPAPARCASTAFCQWDAERARCESKADPDSPCRNISGQLNCTSTLASNGMCIWHSEDHRCTSPPEPPPPPCNRNSQGAGNCATPQQWGSWWKAQPPVLALEFLGGRSCVDVNGCVGVQTVSQKCVCYNVKG